MEDETKRLQILEMLESGQIDAEQALGLLQELAAEEATAGEEIQPAADAQALAQPLSNPMQSQAPEASPAQETNPEASVPEPPLQPEILSTPGGSDLPADAKKWRSWWVYPFWVGVGITVIGALLMVQAVQASGIGAGFVCAGVPFTVGLIVLILAWQSRSARWLHLRVQQRPGERPQKIAISFPLPLRLTAWFLRTFRSRIPGMPEQNLDEILAAVGTSATPENPIYIEVNDEEDGEKVQIYIG